MRTAAASDCQATLLQAGAGYSSTWTLDRPAGPIQLAPGLDRARPACLMDIQLGLPRFLGLLLQLFDPLHIVLAGEIEQCPNQNHRRQYQRAGAIDECPGALQHAPHVI